LASFVRSGEIRRCWQRSSELSIVSGDGQPEDVDGFFDMVRNSGNSSSEDNVLVNFWVLSSLDFVGLPVEGLSSTSFVFGGGSRPFDSHFSREIREAIIQDCIQ